MAFANVGLGLWVRIRVRVVVRSWSLIRQTHTHRRTDRQIDEERREVSQMRSLSLPALA
jgi:hypothetical protein